LITLICHSSAQVGSYPQKNISLQRAGQAKTYHSSAQVRPNISLQRAGQAKHITPARRSFLQTFELKRAKWRIVSLPF
jgi:hypothetical protein